MSIETRSGGTMAAAISNAVVRIVNDYSGRGPTKTRTYISDDLIITVMQDSLTKGEKSLVASGHETLVLQARRALQAAMERDLVEVVEEHSDRKVAAFFSDQRFEPDIAIEVFLME